MPLRREDRQYNPISAVGHLGYGVMEEYKDSPALDAALLAVTQAVRVRVFSRHGKDWTEQVPSIVETMHTLPVSSVVRNPG
jgi:hypothetical protein